MASSTHSKVRENRLRRTAERRGLRLEKSRRRDPAALGYGKYMLIDVRNSNGVVLGAGPTGEADATLDDVEDYLTGREGGVMPKVEFSQELLDRMRMGPREAAWRYFHKGGGPRFFWTVEKADHGGHEGYISGVYRPVGPGSRSGNATAWELDPKSVSAHRLRRDAKARARRLYDEWAGGER